MHLINNLIKSLVNRMSKNKGGDPLDNYNPQVWPSDPVAQRRTWEDAMTT